MAIKVTYFYSACILTETPDVKVLHDPWFTDGIYDGSWFQFPVPSNPIDKIGEVDYIYVSHIHPDHYDPVFLKKYFKKYGRKKILIADHQPNFLARKISGDGFDFSILSEDLQIGDTTIKVWPHKTGSISDIDSAILICNKNGNNSHVLLNTNDIIFDDSSIKSLSDWAGNNVDILLCGYTGAGPYPQTYFDVEDPLLEEEAIKKKKSFFDRYNTLTAKINANVNIPFAGKYILGGELSHLNHFRGVADPVEVLEFDSKAIVLADMGGTISTEDLKPTKIRLEKYSLKDLESRINEISSHKFDYELFPLEVLNQLPIERLLKASYERAILKSACEEDYFFTIKIKDKWVVLNVNRNMKMFDVCSDVSTYEPRSEIRIDERYLFGLLTGVFHWNNAEVGSMFSTRRHPNVFNRSAQSFLNFLSVV